MSSEGVVWSPQSVRALRDFALAYYYEHEGPSESEHKARDLAQALDGDLARAAQAAPEPMWNCMCGHCESWSDDGDGMGWCCEHNTPTVSGHTCKRARPKAEYAEPAEPEGECPSIQELMHHHQEWADYGQPTDRPKARAYHLNAVAALRALAADWAKLEQECAEQAVERLGLVKELEGMKERCAAFGCDALRELQERAEQAEARALAAEKRAEGCFRLPKGKWQEPHFPFDGWRSYLRAVAETIERQWQRPDLNPREQSRPMRELLDAIERGPEGEGVWPTRDVIRMARRYTPLSGGICLNAKDLGIPAEWLVPSEAGERTEG